MAIKGTVAELSGKIRFNGHTLSAAQFSVLTSLGFGVKVGEKEKAPNTRGRAAAIWELGDSFTASVEVVES